MPHVVDWGRELPRDILQRAVETLHRGGLVAFPTDTFYEVGCLASDADALTRLQCHAGGPLTIAAAGSAQLLDWCPEISPGIQRLARNSWPGPLTLACACGTFRGRAHAVSDEACGRLFSKNELRVRSPGHHAIQQILPLLNGPLALAELKTDWTTAEPLVQELGDAVEMVIDDGPTLFGQRATVLRVENGDWEIVREGVLTATDLKQLMACFILFVCTGNTCRSPLAQALCAKLLADRLGCSAHELPERGIIVQSAGLAAMMGAEAAREAVAVALDYGADLSGHRSRPLTAEILARADFLIAMTGAQVQTLAAFEAHGGPTPRLLSGQGEDIPDPIGASAEVYRQCAQKIMGHLQELLPILQVEAR